MQLRNPAHAIISLALAHFFSPKICNCWLLATNTKPFATTGTRFASPPIFGQDPAVPTNSRFIVLSPDSGSNAKSRIGVLLVFSGRAKAQMIGLESPFDDTTVKNPGSCEPPNEADCFIMVNVTLGEVWSFHTLICRPPLLTTRAIPSEGST